MSMKGLTALMLVGAGGALGSMMRFAVSDVLPSSVFPWPTLTVNLLGSFLLAFLLFTVIREHPSSEALSLFLLMGMLGGFTTFSTFTLETIELMIAEEWAWAIVNIILNVTLCLSGAYIGMKWSKRPGD